MKDDWRKTARPYHPKVQAIVDVAMKNGCIPINIYGTPYCGCFDRLHFGDQQSSMITERSAANRRVRHLRLVVSR